MIKQPAIFSKRNPRHQRFLALAALFALLVYAGSAIGGVTYSSWGDGTNTIAAAISGPNSADKNTNFSVNVEGAISGGGAFDVYAFAVYEDAIWSYNQNHMVEISSGTLVDGSGFNFGASHSDTYTFNESAGVHTYTYVFGIRSMGHHYFDIAVDLTVIVE